MNTANLQLKGILLALYALLDTLKSKGVLNQQEIEDALKAAEAKASTEAEERDGLSEANADAIAFPIRFLQEANSASKQMESFSMITQLVAEKNQ